MNKEFHPELLDRMMEDGVREQDIIDAHNVEVRRDIAHRNKVKNRLYRAAALGLTVAGLAALNGGLNSNEQHQRAVSDEPGQAYLEQGLKDGTVDPALAVHLDK